MECESRQQLLPLEAASSLYFCFAILTQDQQRERCCLPSPCKKANPLPRGSSTATQLLQQGKEPKYFILLMNTLLNDFYRCCGFFFSLTNKNNFKNTTESSKFPSISMCNYKWYTTATDSYLDVHMKWSTHEKATAMIICVLIVSTVLLTSRSSRNTQKSVFDKWKKALTGQGGLYFDTSANCKQKN